MLSQFSSILRSKKSALLFLAAIFLSVKIKSINIETLLELEKCPACYGNSACGFVKDIELEYRDPGTLLSYFTGTRNVFRGSLADKRFVIKKLADDAELRDFDRRICQTDSSEPCVNINASNEDLYGFIKKTVSLDFGEDDLSRLRICPSTNRLMTLLNRAYSDKGNFDGNELLFNAWTIVSINPEPIMLQVLSVEDGWPVPKYFGACGRVIVEDYVGPTLNNYFYAAWPVRLKIAFSLLDAAYKFTFQDREFGFYLTDVSADNVAVDSNDSAVFVDLENVIVVDRNISTAEQPIGWEELHANDMGDAENLIFSSEDICGHGVSDHNYYTVCQLIAETGLLRDVTIDTRISWDHGDVNDLLENCIIPGSYDRISAGNQLKELLGAMIGTVL